MADMLFGLAVDLCVVREEPASDPTVNTLVVPGRLREDSDLVSTAVSFDEVDDLFRCLSLAVRAVKVVVS